MAAAASSEKINTESTHEMTKSVSENSIRPIVTDGLSDALLRIATDTHSQFFSQISHSQKWTSDSQKNANCDRLDTPGFVMSLKPPCPMLKSVRHGSQKACASLTRDFLMQSVCVSQLD